MRRRAVFTILLFALVVAAPARPADAAGLGKLIASASTCPGQTDPGASLVVQERAMRCMTDYARERKGMRSLSDVRVLDRAAGHKSGDILRCDEFRHDACGREFTFWMGQVGYLGRGCSWAGENIAWGNGSFGSVRSIFTGWIHSAEHRGNILGPAFRDLGVGLRIGNLEGRTGAHVWTQEFGAHC